MSTLIGSIDTLDSSMPMFRDVLGSTESISLQTSKEFPEKLISLIDSIFEFTTKHDKDYGDPTDSSSASIKHRRMKTFIDKYVQPEFKKVVKKYTGVVIKNLETSYPSNIDNVCSIYVCLSKCDTYMSKLIYAAEGNVKGQLRNANTVKDVLKVTESLDRERGKILKEAGTLGVVIGLPIGIFVLGDFLPKAHTKYQPTSREIVSALLHELGHVFAWVEYMADLSYTGYYGNNALRDTDQLIKKDPKGLKKELDKKLDKAGDNSKLRMKLSSSIDTLLSKISDDDISDTENIYAGNTLWIILILLLSIYLGKYTIFTAVKLMIIPNPPKGKSNSTGSRSLYVDENNTTMWERLADEYVSRYRMSPELNSMLIKIGKIQSAMMARGFMIPVFNSTIRDSFALRAINVALRIPVIVGISVMGAKLYRFSGSSYETTIKRLSRNVSNNIDMLKDSSLPPAIRNELIEDISIMEKQLATIPFKLHNNITNFINLPGNIITSILNNTLGDGGVSSDYAKLAISIDNMLSTRAYKTASQLDTLFKK
jgi:hypothetical protein